MGYTHYWYGQRSFTDVEWKAVQKFTRKIVKQARKDGISIDREYDDKSQKVIFDDLIAFNGRGEDGHETFLLQKTPKDFTFCKTARKPYDDVVVAVLAMADIVAPGALKLSSDGNEHGPGGIISTPFDNPFYLKEIHS